MTTSKDNDRKNKAVMFSDDNINRAGHGVRRLNRLPLFMFFLLLVVLFLVVLYSIVYRGKGGFDFFGSGDNDLPLQRTDSYETIKDQLPKFGDPYVGQRTIIVQQAAPSQRVGDDAEITINELGITEDEEPDIYDKFLTEREFDKFVSRYRRYDLSLSANTDIKGVASADEASQSELNASISNNSPTNSLGSLAQDQFLDNKDQNNQAGKRDFLKGSGYDPSAYLQTTRLQPLTHLELKAGTLVPAVMLSGINTDLPGQIIAQVSENVYDTATGQWLLIPQGSRLVGAYDSSVSFGYNRVLIVWNRLIYPDTSSITLGDMQGVDVEGYAGFKDKVNFHFLRLFLSAAILSIGVDNIDSNDIVLNTPVNDITDALQSPVQQLVKKYLDRQPTIEIRPGYRFNLFLSKDIAFNRTYDVSN